MGDLVKVSGTPNDHESLFQRSWHKTPKVYLAGKVDDWRGGWREYILGFAPNQMGLFAERAALVEYADGYWPFWDGDDFTYTGPWFVENGNHGIGQGDGSHGVLRRRKEKQRLDACELSGKIITPSHITTYAHNGDDGTFEIKETNPYAGLDVAEAIVWQDTGEEYHASDVSRKCLAAIDCCDIVFAYINSPDCHGTLIELGYARARGKRIWVHFASVDLRREVWFAKSIAHYDDTSSAGFERDVSASFKKMCRKWFPEKFSPDGFVYILKAGPYYKIGRTTQIDNRIKQLKIQLPYEVEVVTHFPCERHAVSERVLHEQFAEFRTNGEWFNLPDSAIEELTRIRAMSGGNLIGISSKGNQLGEREDIVDAEVVQ